MKFWLTSFWVVLCAIHPHAQDTWASINVNPGNPSYFRSIIWADSQFIAVGYGGFVLTSQNGDYWTMRNTGTLMNSYLHSLTWTGNQVVAVGDSGTILTSPDGITWTRRISGTASSLYSVTWTGSQFVAVGNDVLTSPDGITWSNSNIPGNALFAVTWAKNVFVAVGANGRIMSSQDGVSWTLRNSRTIENLNAIAFRQIWPGGVVDTIFTVVGSNGMSLTSPNGITWDTSVVKTGGTIYSINCSGQNCVEVGAGGYIRYNGTIQTSNTVSALFSVTRSGNRLMIVGNYHGVVYSNSLSGNNWINKALIQADGLSSVIYTGTQLVAIGIFGTVRTSQDVTNWKLKNFITDSRTTSDLRSVVWTGSQLIAVGGANRIPVVLTSQDGNSWTPRNLGSPDVLHSITWGGNQLVAVGEIGLAYTSPDGISWTARNIGITGLGLSSVTWGDSQFVAVGGLVNCTPCVRSNFVLTSLDGITWTVRDSVSDRFLRRVIWTGSQYVAVGYKTEAIGYSGVVKISPDGITWNEIGTGSNQSLTSVTWTGNQLVAVGGNSVVVSSPDGINWTLRNPSGFSLNNIIWMTSQTLMGNKLVSVNGGWALISPEELPTFISYRGSQNGQNLHLKNLPVLRIHDILGRKSLQTRSLSVLAIPFKK